jgi:hypothetical protein
MPVLDSTDTVIGCDYNNGNNGRPWMEVVMISDERIEEIVANHKRMDVLSLHHIRQAIKQALSEAEPLYRADERRKFADWLENGKTLYTQIRKRLANQLRDQKSVV